MKYRRQLQLAAFVLVLAVYIAARFWNLTQSCLWFDEIFSVHAAEHSWNTILSFVSLDLIHPPLFYVLLKVWIGAGGEGLFWLRLFPVVISIIAVFPFDSLCRELKLGRWTQTLALFLLSVNGSLIKYAQEVRMYSLLMCLSLFSMWLFARYFIKGKSFLPLVIVNVLMVYTHYFGWLVIVSEVTLILWFQRIKWRRITVMLGIVLASFIPWIVAVWQAAAGGGLGQNIGWMSRPGPREIVTFVLNIIEPFYSKASSAESLSIFRVTLPLLLIVVTAAAVYSVEFVKVDINGRRNAYFLPAFFKLPVIAVFIVSWLLPYSIWGTRHLIIVFAPFMIWLSTAISEIPLKWLRTVAVTLIVLFSGYAFVLQSSREVTQHSWCAWGPLAIDAATALPEIDPIYTVEDLVAYHLWFAERGKQSEGYRVSKLTGMEGIQEDKAYFLPRGFDSVTRVDLANVADTRLWLAYRSVRLSDSEPPLRNFILKGYRILDRKVQESYGETATMVLLEK